MAKKDTTAIYLAINIFAFLCCWAAAMGFLSWFDAPVGILLVFATVAGYLQGAVREILGLFVGLLSLVVAWLLAVWLTHTIGFGFFFSKLHYAYISWFVILAIAFLYLSKKVLIVMIRKCHNQKWLREISFRLGVATGIAKGVFLCYLYLAIIHFSGFLVTNFPEQVKKSMVLDKFISMEKQYQLAEGADFLNLHHSIIDMESRWKFYGVIGGLYPGDYFLQRKALDILTPVIYNNKTISEFRDSKKGKELILILSKLKNMRKIWKKNTNNIKVLKARTHSPRKILILLYQKRLQEVFESEDVKKFLRQMP
ncbi:CvpA family protein [Candidatus Uabimicrobium sp. HlEnr_7]|uniref:CvpA family protein n=1 Tax=Candidatus Uabimicrobium helgolandensis TaxID=3095367 RepID=UPI0035569E5D